MREPNLARGVEEENTEAREATLTREEELTGDSHEISDL